MSTTYTMSSRMRDELEEFSQGHVRKGRKCAICTLPPDILDAINYHRLTREPPTPFTRIAQWLINEKGIIRPGVSQANLERHFLHHVWKTKVEPFE